MCHTNNSLKSHLYFFEINSKDSILLEDEFYKKSSHTYNDVLLGISRYSIFSYPIIKRDFNLLCLNTNKFFNGNTYKYNLVIYGKKCEGITG